MAASPRAEPWALAKLKKDKFPRRGEDKQVGQMFLGFTILKLINSDSYLDVISFNTYLIHTWWNRSRHVLITLHLHLTYNFTRCLNANRACSMGSLWNHTGDVKDNIKWMMIYFTYKSHNTLKSITFLITVKSLNTNWI